VNTADTRSAAAAAVHAEAAATVAGITASIRRLAEISRTDAEMSSLVSVLELLTADGESNPLAALGDLITDGSEYLREFEDESADAAADRMEDTAGYTESMRDGLNVVLYLARPLAG
jgi:hypothetical protein